ncbi:dormancy-associated protein homolog 3 isoform X1 [Silene latifolia]|uniref:dormancy-associated protein homolog 3 isoform X1 n=1 Tax=Silene latifolia TaxID=37657 RepID=UPI003D78511C
MGLLEKLWDDTLAGPHPDSGLGKLRKFNTFSPRGKDNEGMGGRSEGEEAAEEVKVTRSIMIMKPPGYQQTAGSAPASPAGSTPPVSPFSDREHSDFGGDQPQMQTRRRRMRTDPAEALLLLKMSDI